MRGDIGDYCATAAPRLARGATFACVFPLAPDGQRRRIEAAAAGAGFDVIRLRPVVLREPEPPLLGLFCMALSSDLPEAARRNPWREPPLIIRTSCGAIHPEYPVIKLSFGFPP